MKGLSLRSECVRNTTLMMMEFPDRISDRQYKDDILLSSTCYVQFCTGKVSLNLKQKYVLVMLGYYRLIHDLTQQTIGNSEMGNPMIMYTYMGL